MKFQAHGIKTAQGLEKARYMLSTLTDDRRCITVCADGYKRFSQEVRDAFAVENNSDIMTDYFEKDSFRVFPEHPLFHEVAEGFRKVLAYRIKVSRHKDYARRTLEELEALAASQPAGKSEPSTGSTPASAQPRPIVVCIHGGVVTDVSGVPEGYELHIEDYDVIDPEHPQWNVEKECLTSVYL